MFLTKEQWQARACAERERTAPFVEAHRERRKRGEKHPVWDFLWTYYSFKPALLSRFSPGVGVELEGGEWEWDCPQRTATTRGARLDWARFPANRLDEARAILALLEATHSRPARHDCFGWHEWAMVYRSDAMRHEVPLRLNREEIADLLDTQTLRCSHFDAVRFWTPAALPLQFPLPMASDRANWEQPGCIHANMDLYRFAACFAPWISSALVVETFLLARRARELDMRASPYDLAAFGFAPILLETPDGRRQYAGLQREVAQDAAPLRARLVEAYRELIEVVASCG